VCTLNWQQGIYRVFLMVYKSGFKNEVWRYWNLEILPYPRKGEFTL